MYYAWKDGFVELVKRPGLCYWHFHKITEFLSVSHLISVVKWNNFSTSREYEMIVGCQE